MSEPAAEQPKLGIDTEVKPDPIQPFQPLTKDGVIQVPKGADLERPTDQNTLWNEKKKENSKTPKP